MTRHVLASIAAMSIAVCGAAQVQTTRKIADAQETRVLEQLQAMEKQVETGGALPIETETIDIPMQNIRKVETGVRSEVAGSWITSTAGYINNAIDKPELRGLEVADFVRREVDKQLRERRLNHGELGLVQREDIQSYVGALVSILERAKADPQFRVTFQVITAPSGATFELCREYVPTDCYSVGTNVRLADIFRGRYLYRIKKPGYQKVEAKLNLVNFSQSRLWCPLRADTDRAGAVPCTPQ